MSLRCLRLVRGLAFGGLLLWGSSAPAQNYVNISHSPGWQSDCPRLAVDPDGNVHAVWAEIYTISGVYFLTGDAFYSKYDIVTQQWSLPLNLSNSGLVANGEGFLVDITSDASGTIYVVYVNSIRIMLRTLTGGNWSAPFEVGVSGSTIDQTRVEVTPEGDIFTCWWDTGSGICYSRARIGGNWESIKQVSPPGVRSKFPDIAVGANAAYCVYMGASNTYHVVVTGRALTSGAGWTTPLRATSSADQEQQPVVALDSGDIAHVLYTPEFDMQRIVRYVFGTVAGFSAPLDLTAQGDVHFPSIHANGDNLYACWQAPTGVAYSNRIDGAWSPAKVLPNTSAVNYLTDVATSPDQAKVYYVWESGSGLNADIFFSGPLTAPGNMPPTADFSFSPTTGIFPVDIGFDASASFDPDGTITQYAWNFGDGSMGTGKIATHNYKTFGTFAVRLAVTDDKGATASATKTIQILRLFQPLNIQVTPHADESLFRIRYLNVVTWEKNPANDSIGATISTYRVYRKLKAEADSAYTAIVDVPGSTFTFTDKTGKTAAEKDLYAYTVTSLNPEGKESPILTSSAGGFPAPVKSTHLRKSKLAK
jgi:PKD repeat protein